MSASPLKTDLRTLASLCPLSAMSRLMHCTNDVHGCNNLLDYLIGAREQLRRHREAERLGGRQVDDQIELRGGAQDACVLSQQTFRPHGFLHLRPCTDSSHV